MNFYYAGLILASYPLFIFFWVCIEILLEIPSIYQTLKECDMPDSIWNIFKAGLELHLFHGMTSVKSIFGIGFIWTIILGCFYIKIYCL